MIKYWKSSILMLASIEAFAIGMIKANQPSSIETLTLDMCFIGVMAGIAILFACLAIHSFKTN